MLPEITPQEFSAALDSVAQGACSHLADLGPPVDALKLAQTLGLAVAWDERQAGRGRTARLAGRRGSANRGSILLKPDPRRERLQWAIAHEIGEGLAHRVFDQLAIDPREAPRGAREMVANQLAARILLPRDTFAVDGADCDWDLFELKSRYATASHELVARRMLDFAPQVIITVFDHGKRTMRRSNLPFRTPALNELEHAAWRVCHEQGTVVIEADYTCRVHAWPVHEPEWKREILRSEWLAE